jgi:putative SOS response-associated peptidase YedK
MCGRYLITGDEGIEEMEAIIREAEKNLGGLTLKQGEIFPTNCAPIVSRVSGKTVISAMRWGFSLGAKSVINAKSETVEEKSMFAAHFRDSRCVVPATGFYEWAHANGKPTGKYLFNEPGSRMLYMAGIASRNRVIGAGERADSFVILTRAANSSISDVHDRMPVILRKDELIRYMSSRDEAMKLIERDSIELSRQVA